MKAFYLLVHNRLLFSTVLLFNEIYTAASHYLLWIQEIARLKELL